MIDKIQMSIDKYSLDDLQSLWILLWAEMFDTGIEPEEAYETATVLQEFVRRIETGQFKPGK